MNEFIAPQFPKFYKPSLVKDSRFLNTHKIHLEVDCLHDGSLTVDLSIGGHLVLTSGRSPKTLAPGDSMVINGTLDVRSMLDVRTI